MTVTKKRFFLGSILGLWLVAASFPAAENMTIQVHLFKGAWAEGHPGLKEVMVMTTASHPALEALKARVEGPESLITAAAIDALLEAQGLKTVDDLLSFAKPWSGKDIRLSEVIILGRTGFLFNFNPRRLSAQKVGIATSLFKSKITGAGGASDDRLNKEFLDAFSTGKVSAGMEKILDLSLDLDIGDAAFIAIPTEGGAYFMMIALVSGARPSGQLEFAGGPRVIHQVVPSYPEELRRQGIEGQVELQVGIDEEGNVGGVRVLKSLHPFLDDSAVHALKQWKYEPVYQNGVPVPAVITMTVNFTREAYRHAEEAAAVGPGPTAGPENAARTELRGVLERCAEYCDRLKGAALDYICEETIRDVYFNLPTEEELKKQSSIVVTMISGAGSVAQLGISRMPFPNPRRTERNAYVCDYLFVKKGEGIRDQRIVLEENGRKLADRSKILEERRFAALTPFFVPVRLLGRDRQTLFDYKVLKDDRIKGKAVFVIEVDPKAGNAAGVEHAKVWVEKISSQVVKVEMTGMPFEGYESVLSELIQYNIGAKFAATYAYGVEKKGLAFPSEVKVRVNYPFPGFTPQVYSIEKIRTDLKYDKYKFFTVETDGAVKK